MELPVSVYMCVLSTWLYWAREICPDCSNSCILSHTPGLEGRVASVGAEARHQRLAARAARRACSQTIYQHSLGHRYCSAPWQRRGADTHCARLENAETNCTYKVHVEFHYLRAGRGGREMRHSGNRVQTHPVVLYPDTSICSKNSCNYLFSPLPRLDL